MIPRVRFHFLLPTLHSVRLLKAKAAVGRWLVSDLELATSRLSGSGRAVNVAGKRRFQVAESLPPAGRSNQLTCIVRFRRRFGQFVSCVGSSQLGQSPVSRKPSVESGNKRF